MKTLKPKPGNNETLVGSWLTFNYTATAEIMARSGGYDFLVIDMEHSAITAEQMWRMIQVIDLAGNVPLVRVGANDPRLIKQALDSGASGIIVPMVNTVAEAAAAVQATYYPPNGRRGVGLWRAQNYGMGFEDYKRIVAPNVLLLVQIEHYQAVEELEAILALDGIDGFLIGPYDLSGSLGEPGNFSNPRFQQCLQKVQQIVRSSRKLGGYHIVHPDIEGRLMREKLAEGYRFVVYGTDMIFFTEQVKSRASALIAARPSATQA